MKIIETQEEFDLIALEDCEKTVGNSGQECVECWKAGYLYALQQLYNFRESEEFDDCFDYIDKTDKKINEFLYLDII